MKTPTRNYEGLFRKCTTQIGLLALFVLVSTPVVGQPIVGHQRKVDIKAHWGYTAVSSRDAPSQAAVGSQLTTSALGGSVSVAVGAGLRLGMEVLHGNWPTWRGSENSLTSTLVSVLVEHEFWSYERLNPYLVLGVGYNNLRWRGPSFDPSLPEYRGEKKGRLHLGGGIGTRFFLTRNFFVAPEFRIGLRPLVRWTVSGGYAF